MLTTDHRAQTLALLTAKFAAVTEAHKQARDAAEHASSLDRALELEPAEHGIEFDETVFEVLKQSGCK